MGSHPRLQLQRRVVDVEALAQHRCQAGAQPIGIADVVRQQHVRGEDGLARTQRPHVEVVHSTGF